MNVFYLIIFFWRLEFKCLISYYYNDLYKSKILDYTRKSYNFN